MEKSLLELLKKEDDLVKSVFYVKESESYFMSMAEKADDIEEADICRRIASRKRERIHECEAELVVVRREMKEYLSYIMSL